MVEQKLAVEIPIDSAIDFTSFYESILTSFDNQKVPVLDEKMLLMVEKEGGGPLDITGYAWIMISSWIEFLNNLFLNFSADNLLTNLNNHLSFIKRLDVQNHSFHLDYFKKICTKLFQYILKQKVVFNTQFEIEDEYKTFELDLFLLHRKTKLENLVFYILSHDFNEINQTTEKHIRAALQALYKNDQAEFNLHFNELRAIQETILTILQLDRKEQKSPLVRKLQKEFNLINQFCFILQKISETNFFPILKEHKLEFRSSYDYPFLDVLKNLGRWYLKSDLTYLKNALEIFDFIRSKKPYRKEDIDFFSRIEDILNITDDYRFLSKSDVENFLQPFVEYLSNPGISWSMKTAILEFLNNLSQQRNLFKNSVQQTIDFFLQFFENKSITLIYRRQIFINIAIILQSWIKANLIPAEQSKNLINELVRIDKNLKKQPLKKMGSFVKISYQLEPELLLPEFEKGLATHLLFALEDFGEWEEGKQYRAILQKSNWNRNPRYIVAENLYKIAAEISENETSSENNSEGMKIKSALIRGFYKRILDDYFKFLPELLQIIYGALLVHIAYLAEQREKILSEDCNWLLEKLKEWQKIPSRKFSFPLLQYSSSQVFTGPYEKELSSTISILHLYAPLISLVTL